MRRLLGVLLAATSLSACGGETGPPNVLILVVDALRPDRLGYAGGERPTSPTVDALATSGVRFDRAHSAAPWTLPSVASILTGLYPSGHGARTQRNRVPPGAPLLAEILQAHGYRTAAVVSHVFVGSDHDLDRGFDTFREDHARGHEYASTNGVTEQALDALRNLHGSGDPFFLFVHYFDPHYDFLRHPEIGFAPVSAGRLRGDETIQQIRQLESPTEEELDFLLALYDEEIRFTDDGIGRLLGELDRLGLTDETIVVFTADHGEEFWEHGRVGHGRTLYQELVHVPLVIRAPGGARGRVVARPVTNVAVAPTVLDLLGLPTDVAFQAASLAPEIRPTERADEIGEAEFPVFAEVEYDRFARFYSIVGNRFKLIQNRNDETVVLHDLAEDPGETTDVAAEHPDVVERMRTMMGHLVSALERRPVAARDGPMTEEREKLLRGLGYVD